MPSLVQELQTQTLDAKVPVTDLLRKVKVIASKLNVTDLLTWVDHELNGYPDGADIPDYREIRGVAHAFNPMRGWLKIEFEDPDFEERISTQKSRQPISEIEEMTGPGDGDLTFTASSALSRGGLRYASDPRIFVSRSQIVRIVDAVRNRILDWALALEKRGVLGDGLTFSPDEKARAATVTYNVTQTIYGHHVAAAGSITAGKVMMNVGTGPMEDLATALRELAAAAQRESASTRLAIVALADQAAAEASSRAPDISLLGRLLIGTAAVVQGIASLGPAWTAVTTEAARLGLHVALPGS